MEKIHFENPEFFWLLILVPLAIFWQTFKVKTHQVSLKISDIGGVRNSKSWVLKLRPALFVFRLLAIVLIIIALSRPRNESLSVETKTTKGIDIVMAVDVSSSMLAKDLKPNRFEALKVVAIDFTAKRTNDRIGIVIYAGESYTKTPVTIDKALVIRALKEITYGQLDDGTAIGMGLSTAVNRLKDSKSKSKIIILLTDGVNNTGFIEPITAAELAVQHGIKVYTIALGTKGMAMSPVARNADGSFVYDLREVEIDEGLLKAIARRTGGMYYRATGNKKLEAIYNEIDKLEKTEIDELRYYNYEEKYRLFALLSFIFLFLEVFLKYTLFKSFI